MKSQFPSFALLMSVMAFATASCQDNAGANERAQNMANLERFVDSVETQVSATARHDWAAIDRRYEQLEDKAEQSLKGAVDEEKSAFEKLELRYNQIEEDAEMRSEQLKAETQVHMKNIELWYDRTKENAEDGTENVKDAANEAGESIEEGFEESMNWFEKNYDNLEDNTRQQYDKIKDQWKNKS